MIEVLGCLFSLRNDSLHSLDNVLETASKDRPWSAACADANDEGITVWPQVFGFIVSLLDGIIIAESAVDEFLPSLADCNWIEESRCGRCCPAGFPHLALIIEDFGFLRVPVRPQNC
jgi:hypothetical protein